MLLFVQQDHFSSQGGGLNALAAGGAGGMYNTFNQPSGVRFLNHHVNVQTELKSPTEHENLRSVSLPPSAWPRVARLPFFSSSWKPDPSYYPG